MNDRWLETFRRHLSKETDLIANLANFSAYLSGFLKNINWVGFYLVREDELVLGPFQGKAACTRIPVGKGVCGDCVEKRKAIHVANVHQYEGHIVCDGLSKSELVIPIIKEGKVVGVLDVDSPIIDRFTEDDEKNLLKVVKLLENLNW